MERVALSDLMAEYGMALDEDRLEGWVELLEADSDSRVVTRENVAQGLPNVLMWCDNKNMLRDRVESYRHVNQYNPHYDRPVIGPLRLFGEKNGGTTFEASYSLFQTDLEGNSRIFSVGRYRVEARMAGGVARVKSMLVVADTGTVPSLLATPI